MTALARNITPIYSDVYKKALDSVYSAGDDWPRILRAAQVLSQSPVWWHQSTADHVFTAHSMREAGLLKAYAEARQERLMLIEAWRTRALDAPKPVKPPYSPQVGLIREWLAGAIWIAAISAVALAVYMGEWT